MGLHILRDHIWYSIEWVNHLSISGCGLQTLMVVFLKSHNAHLDIVQDEEVDKTSQVSFPHLAPMLEANSVPEMSYSLLNQARRYAAHSLLSVPNSRKLLLTIVFAIVCFLFFLFFVFCFLFVWSFRLFSSWSVPLRQYSSSKFPSYYSPGTFWLQSCVLSNSFPSLSRTTNLVCSVRYQLMYWNLVKHQYKQSRCY